MSLNRDGVFQETISAYEQPDYEGRIQQLETDLKEANEKLADKDKEIATLSNDVNMLDRGLHEHKSRHEQNWTNVFNQLRKDIEIGKDLIDERDGIISEQAKSIKNLREYSEELTGKHLKLQVKLANIKYLDEPEVKEILGLYYNYYFAQSENIEPINDSAMNEEQAITALLALAIPEVNRDRIKSEIDHESFNLSSVIFEIIQRCFIDYDGLPKAKDVCGILKSDELNQ